VATAVGLYRIRRKIAGRRHPKRHGTYPRTFENSEIRPDSCRVGAGIRAELGDEAEFRAGNNYRPEDMVPPTPLPAQM